MSIRYLCVLVLVPSAVRLLGMAVSITSATALGIKLTVVLSVTPPLVAVMVAVPTLVGLTSQAVAIPLVVKALMMVGVAGGALSNSPAVVVKVTGVLFATLFPLLSCTVAVISVFDDPSATAVSEPELTDTAPITTSISVMSVSSKMALLVASALTVCGPRSVEAV